MINSKLLKTNLIANANVVYWLESRLRNGRSRVWILYRTPQLAAKAVHHLFSGTTVDIGPIIASRGQYQYYEIAVIA